MRNRIWYSYMGTPYPGYRSATTDLSGIAWFDALTANIPAIKNEVLALLTSRGVQLDPYFYSEFNLAGGEWKTKAFIAWGLPNNKVKKLGKNVFRFFENIPGMVSLSISALEPSTHIQAHYGETDATLRLHVPILVPSQGPECALKVNGVAYPWEEGRINVFCDAHLHEAWNRTEQQRIVLIVDVVRPEYLSITRSICAHCVAMLGRQTIFVKLGIEDKIPQWARPRVIAICTRLLTIPARVLLSFRNAF